MMTSAKYTRPAVRGHEKVRAAKTVRQDEFFSFFLFQFSKGSVPNNREGKMSYLWQQQRNDNSRYEFLVVLAVTRKFVTRLGTKTFATMLLNVASVYSGKLFPQLKSFCFSSGFSERQRKNLPTTRYDGCVATGQFKPLHYALACRRIRLERHGAEKKHRVK